MADSARKTEVSVVIPVCNEAGTVKELHARLTKVLSDAVKSFEIIFVDDGSNDGTLEALKVLRPVTIVRLSHNSGKTTATAAGVRESKGEIIVTMDGDLENLPEDIPLLLEKIYKQLLRAELCPQRRADHREHWN
ncbi:MAG: glycosyltransferase [Candidatus Sungbacteria bacterium]|nr:glycosyltransferase [Candidatus Sungbacteria bacterium]